MRSDIMIIYQIADQLSAFRECITQAEQVEWALNEISIVRI